jgi:putative iron-dependent peroxidase
MFLGDPPGNYDRILDFSTALTGSLFFVPTGDYLDDPPPLPDGSDEEGPPPQPAVPSNGSLGIGGLSGVSS